MILVCHSPRERCGVREYGRQLDSSLTALGATVRPTTYDDLSADLERAAPGDVLLVHFEEQLIHPSERFAQNLFVARMRGMRIVFTCHWYEQRYLDQFRFDKLVLHREYSPRHPGAAIIPLGCPVYVPTRTRAEIRERLGIPEDKTVVTTIGLLATWKRIPEIAAAMLDAFEPHPELHLHVHAPQPSIVDLSGERRKILDAIGGRPNATLSTDFLPADETVDLAWASDLGFAFQPMHTTGVSASTKLFVAARRPIVTTDSSHSSDLTGGVHRVTGFDPSAFAREVAALALDGGRLAALGRSMESEYARLNTDSVARAYLELFQSMEGQALSTGPKICLNMIVKNEAAVIERCLDSALPFIDAWAITDTGSTDDTVKKIERFFAKHGMPGKLTRSGFKDFAQARNAALSVARTVPGWDYALLLDADMVIDGTLDTDMLRGPAYKVVQRDGALEYWNTRLLRRDAPASYLGVTHEYLSVEGAENLAGIFVVDRADGGSKGDKGDRDIRLLNEGLTAEPNNVRYMFYLAQTYRGMGRHHEAIQWYRRRIEAGGWDEEVWASYYGIACSYRDLNDEPNLTKAALDAYNYRPSRGESLKVLAKFLRERAKNESAYLIAETLSAIPYPGDQLFVESDVYAHGADQEISIAGYWSKLPSRREAGYRACARLTTTRDGGVREEARKNFTHYVKSAAELFGADVRKIDWQPGDGYFPMNPSVSVSADGRRLVLVRTVNYTVANGQYPTIDGGSIIRTHNHVVEVDADWRPVRSNKVVDDTALPRSEFPVEGFEDCRLWQDGDRYFASTTVRDLADNPDGRCEMAVARFDEKWHVVEVTPIRDYEGGKTQKNWMPIAGRPGQFLYLCDPTIVIDCSSDKTVEVARHEAPGCLVDLRGGSQLVEHDGGWLAVTHEVAWRPERVYLHRFVKFEADFRVVAVSDPFYFARVGIEFAAGLARDGGRIVASFGVNDASAHLGLFDPASIDRAMNVIR